MDILMGIDGGGSTVRVVIAACADRARRELHILGEAQGGNVNPNTAGYEIAAGEIQAAMRAALERANLTPSEIAAVGIGVAGAMTPSFYPWLHEAVAGVAPDARVALSIDPELALVGAFGERRGVLVLAGTGSVAYGVNEAGESAIVGGWGYLLGDEGSGYWLGLRALQAVVRADDGRNAPTMLAEAVIQIVGTDFREMLVAWVYKGIRTREIALLARSVLACAPYDHTAQRLVEEAAEELALLAQTVVRRLNMVNPAIAFAGGLLSEANPLSDALCARLGLAAPPTPKYAPVMGAALLALDTLKDAP